MRSCGWRLRARHVRACSCHLAPIAVPRLVCAPMDMPRLPPWKRLPTIRPRHAASVAPMSCGPARFFTSRIEQMGNVAVIGAQWGDEGKGKVVDWLASRADVGGRF